MLDRSQSLTCGNVHNLCGVDRQGIHVFGIWNVVELFIHLNYSYISTSKL